jgi:tetratricopeptide (TPR) repeat protein
MEMDGRPDGTRPHGRESLLDYLTAKAQSAKDTDAFRISEENCEELLREGIQYYYRYLSFFHLGRYDLAERDTRRNLRLFAFVRQHAPSEQIKWRFDQYRPYVTMMNTRARATPEYEAKRYREALKIVDEGIGQIHEFLVEHELTEQEDDCVELEFLKRWRREIERVRPKDAAEKLQRQLEKAVESEDYEKAAKLRDELRKLSSTKTAGEISG